MSYLNLKLILARWELGGGFKGGFRLTLINSKIRHRTLEEIERNKKKTLNKR